jgi:hypothetical protein
MEAGREHAKPQQNHTIKHQAAWAVMSQRGLANRRLQPLGHSSGKADMPDAGASRKRQIPGCRIRQPFNDSPPLIEALKRDP